MFVTRDSVGKLNGTYNSAQYPSQEQLPDASAEVVAYISGQAVPDASFLLRRIAALEANMAVVVSVPVVAAAVAVAKPIPLSTPIVVSDIVPVSIS